MVLVSRVSGTTNIFCDGGDCLNHTKSVRGIKGRIRTARAQAKAAGWTYVRLDGQMVDLCPDCSAKRAEKTQNAYTE
jgi:hypothetical protein